MHTLRPWISCLLRLNLVTTIPPVRPRLGNLLLRRILEDQSPLGLSRVDFQGVILLEVLGVEGGGLHHRLLQHGRLCHSRLESCHGKTLVILLAADGLVLVFGLFDAEDNMEGLDENPEGEPGPADQYNDGQAGDDDDEEALGKHGVRLLLVRSKGSIPPVVMVAVGNVSTM